MVWSQIFYLSNTLPTKGNFHLKKQNLLQVLYAATKVKGKELYILHLFTHAFFSLTIHLWQVNFVTNHLNFAHISHVVRVYISPALRFVLC